MKTSTPRLSEVARHVVVPRGVVRSGWPQVAALLAIFGVVFDQWQVDITRLILGKRADGQYAADVSVLSIPRQVGKTFMLGCLVIALCILKPGLLVIWTAHHTATSDETFADMRAIVQLPRLAKLGITVRAANGQQSIIFQNGSRIRFGARERGFGRGFKKVGVLVLDEAQILTANAMDNLIPTTARADNPLVLLAGTPPKPTDPGEAFGRFRADALAAEPGASDILYVEISADPDADPRDREQWAKANPSYPRHTKARAILRLLKTLGPASFRREALGIWDAVSRVDPVMNPDEWATLLGVDPGGDQVAYGVRYSADGSRVAVAGAKPTVDGAFVEVVGVHSGSTSSGLSSLTAWLAERASSCISIVIDGKAGAGALNDALLDAGVNHRKILRPTFDEVITSAANLVEMARDRTVTHTGQPGLQVAVADARRRKIGEQGGWGFGPISEDGDVTPVEAVALAIHGLGGRRRNGRKTGQRGRMVAG